MATGYGQMLQAWAQEPPPKKRESDTNTHGGGQQAVNILLGVILGVAVLFVLTMTYATFSHFKFKHRPIDLIISKARLLLQATKSQNFRRCQWEDIVESLAEVGGSRPDAQLGGMVAHSKTITWALSRCGQPFCLVRLLHLDLRTRKW